MMQIVTIVSLALSVANWMFFVMAVVVENFPRIRSALHPAKPEEMPNDAGMKAHARIDPIITATGGLATSLRSAGPAATAAAMSLACLLIAALAAGLSKI